MPVTAADGSPALNVSTVSGFQSTPMFFLMRSTTSSAVTAPPIDRAIETSGAAATPVAVSATNLRRVILCINPCFHRFGENEGHLLDRHHNSLRSMIVLINFIPGNAFRSIRPAFPGGSSGR
jgi:hypothetical protein